MTEVVLKPTLQKQSVSFSPASPNEYRSWVLGKPHSEKKGKVLEMTLLSYPLVSKEIPFYHISETNEGFSSLLTGDLPQVRDFSSTYKWYTYEKADHFYVDFAHPTVFGGGFRGWGNVQEETLFCEFPDLPELAFATQKKPIHATQSQNPTPFIIPSLRRVFIIHDLYGQAIEKINFNEIAKKIEMLDSDKQPPIHIIGMAAIHWAGEENQYQMDDLKYLLKAAYLGFWGAKQLVDDATVHTAPWGCGVFLNSEKTITVIQTLAAVLAEVNLVFEGVGNPANPHYSTEFIAEAQSLVKSSPNGEAVLQSILDQQNQDNSWAPKTA